MSEREKLLALADKLPAGAKRALMAANGEWQFAGKATFNSNGAWSLHWAKGVGGRGSLIEHEYQHDAGGYHRSAYRLTPLGLSMQHTLRARAAQEPQP